MKYKVHNNLLWLCFLLCANFPFSGCSTLSAEKDQITNYTRKQKENIVNKLDLRPEKAKEFHTLGEKYERDRKEISNELAKKKVELIKLMIVKSPDHAKIRDVVKAISEADCKLIISRIEQEEAELALLTPEQQARYLVPSFQQTKQPYKPLENYQNYYENKFKKDMVKVLNLSPDKAKEFISLKEQYDKESKELSGELTRKRSELVKILTIGELNNEKISAVIRDISITNRKLSTSKINQQDAELALLTPEQQGRYFMRDIILAQDRKKEEKQKAAEYLSVAKETFSKNHIYYPYSFLKGPESIIIGTISDYYIQNNEFIVITIDEKPDIIYKITPIDLDKIITVESINFPDIYKGAKVEIKYIDDIKDGKEYFVKSLRRMKNL